MERFGSSIAHPERLEGLSGRQETIFRIAERSVKSGIARRAKRHLHNALAAHASMAVSCRSRPDAPFRFDTGNAGCAHIRCKGLLQPAARRVSGMTSQTRVSPIAATPESPVKATLLPNWSLT